MNSILDTRIMDLPSSVGVFRDASGGIYFGNIVLYDSQVEDDLPDDFYLDDDCEVVNPEYLKDGYEPGEMYIDYYSLYGDFIQGDCFWYWPTETLGDYMERNGGLEPVRMLPSVIDYDVWAALDNEDAGAVRRLARRVPELGLVDFTKWPKLHTI